MEHFMNKIKLHFYWHLVALLLAISCVSNAAYLLPSQPVTVTTAAYTSVTGTLNKEMLTGNASGWYDTLNQYGSFTADIYTTTTVTGGVITFEQTNDTTNDAAGITLNLQDSTVLTQTNVTSLTLAASTVKHYQASVSARYIRLRISTAFAGTGTVGATVNFRSFSFVPMVQPVSQATAASMNATVTATNLSSNIAQVGGTNTVNAGVAGVISVGGNIAAGTAPTANPMRTAGLAFTAQPTARGTGTLVDWAMSTIGAGIVKEYSVPALDWQASSGTASPLTTGTSTALKAAGAAGIRNYVTACQITNISATVSTLISLLDGATVIWTGYAEDTTSTAVIVPINIVFPTPLQGTAATAMNIQATTTGANIYYNCQGYQAP